MTKSNNTFSYIATLIVSMVAFLALATPLFAGAATYAYVDANGEVKSVTAGSWQTAIATAINIHMHSGVLLLSTPADFEIVGDQVVGAN